MAVKAGAARKVSQKRWRQLNLEPNQRGWPKTDFYRPEGLQKAYIAEITADTTRLGIGSRSIAARIYGATIKPGPGVKCLAIPVRADEYGKRAISQPIPGLFLTYRRGAAPGGWLAARDAASGRLTVYYRLTRQAKNPADKNLLPSESLLQQSISGAVIKHLYK